MTDLPSPLISVQEPRNFCINTIGMRDTIGGSLTPDLTSSAFGGHLEKIDTAFGHPMPGALSMIGSTLAAWQLVGQWPRLAWTT